MSTPPPPPIETTTTQGGLNAPVLQREETKGRECINCHKWLPLDAIHFRPASHDLSKKRGICRTCENKRRNQLRYLKAAKHMEAQLLRASAR